MRVTRTSGMPIDPEHVRLFQEEVRAGYDAIVADLGPFEKLPQEKRGEFQRRFEEFRGALDEKYPKEANWDFETVLKSKTKLKELVNIYGVIAFSRGSKDNKLQCFIIDSGF